MSNVFSIDVEDYYQVEAFSNIVSQEAWPEYECRVEKNTDNMLQLLDDADVKSTFFVLGYVAKKYPSLIRRIHDAGHEIASHGMTHRLIYKQTPEVFRQETFDSKALLEDIIQSDVYGYRAATYSITKNSLWALDILYEAGYRYDSSIFPMMHDRYGVPGSPVDPYIIKSPEGNELIEFPISVLERFSFRLPFAGGGYFRLFPYWLTKWGLRSINKSKRDFVFYIHPWEIDPSQPVMGDISSSTKFRHYVNLRKTESRIKKLLKDFSFDTMKNVIESKKPEIIIDSSLF